MDETNHLYRLDSVSNLSECVKVAEWLWHPWVICLREQDSGKQEKQKL